MKTKIALGWFIFAIFAACRTQAGIPQLNWLTTYAGKYARIYTNNTMLANGTALTTWNNGTENQSNPAYCGIQEVYYSSNWVYVRSSGLASYNMGPWMNGNFPNLPLNQKLLYRIPLTNGVPVSKTENGGGQIGIFVDGVEMFNSWDAYTWSTNTSADTQNITGYWNRDAYTNEGVSFDPGNAHQQNTGVYHYHASPIALRYLLGDNVNFSTTAKTYSESTNAPAKHSPLLGWVADGFPIYGPYGYSTATNPNSGLRRMISGYVIRNGNYGTSNLAANGRTTIPSWAIRLTNVASNQPGPNVTSTYELGRYMEDYDYLGDHGYVPGVTSNSVEFDLDEYNGRYCVTPEFPNGTYAYFVAINSTGTPVFPYNIGRGYYGNPVGAAVTGITEPVMTNFLGNTNLASILNQPVVKSGNVSLVWSALEGGSYQVQSSTNLFNWNLVASNLSPNQITGAYTNVTALNLNLYRVARTSVAAYDSTGTTLFYTGAVAPGGSANRGSTVTVTITLPSSPPSPPANAPLNSVAIGSTYATNFTDAVSGQVIATFYIPTNAPTGLQNVVVTFAMPTFTLTNGFTVN